MGTDIENRVMGCSSARALWSREHAVNPAMVFDDTCQQATIDDVMDRVDDRTRTGGTCECSFVR